MEQNSDTFAELFAKNYGLILAEYRKTWSSLIAHELEEFQQDIELILKPNQSEKTAWEDVESYINKQASWCSRTEQILKEYRAKNFWEISAQYYDSAYKESPETIEIPINPSDWDKDSSDTKYIAIWKFLHRSRNAWIIARFKVINKFRAIVKKPPLEIPGLGSRVVYPNLLAARYVQWAFNKKLLDEWLAFQLETGKLFSDLYLASDAALDTYLLIDSESNDTELTETTQHELASQSPEEVFAAVQAKIAIFKEKFQSASELDPEKLAPQLSSFTSNWKYCGTSALPPGKYNDAAIKKESVKVSEELARSNTRWDSQFTGVFGNWRRKLQWAMLTVKTRVYSEALLTQSCEGIETELLPEFAKNSELVLGSIQKIQGWDDFNRNQAIVAFKRENRLLIKRLTHERLLLLTDTVMQSKLKQHLETFLARLKAATELIPEKQTLLINRGLDHLMPNPKVESIPARELIAIYGLEPLDVKYAELILNAENNHRSTLRSISMMDQIIDFQFETAITLIQQKRDGDVIAEAKQLLIEGLERLISQFKDLTEENQAFIVATKTTISTMSTGFVESIRMLEDSDKVFELNLKLTRAKTKSHYRSMRRQVFKKIETYTFRVLKFTKDIFLVIVLSYRRLRKYTGIEESKTRVEDDIQLLLTDTYSPLDRLPLVYQRLFKIDALKETRFFYQRKNEFAALEYEFFSWQESPTSPVVLVGEKGSGKSTLLNYTSNQVYHDLRIYEFTPNSAINDIRELLKILVTTFEMADVESLEDLEKKVSEELEPSVFIFENIQKLFLRKVGGFAVLQRMLLFISRTSNRVHWVVSCSLYSWEYLDKAVKCSKYFHKIIQLDALSVAEIETVIMQRHRTSGFEVVFDPSSALLRSSKYKKLPTEKAKQEYLNEIFFKDLQEISQGNIVVAMLFWITAIKEIRKAELVLNTTLVWDQSPFQKLPPDDLFTLAAIVLHDGLTVEQHGKVFYQDYAKSLAMITRLRNNGLLVESEFGFSIQPMLYRPIVETLKSKNILH